MIVDEIKRIMRPDVTEPEHDCTAIEVANAITLLLDEIILKDEAQCELLGQWHNEIRSLQCKLLREHSWAFDHCGYWGHQYCECCNVAKYPDLRALRCSEAHSKIGNIKESEYRKRMSLRG